MIVVGAPPGSEVRGAVGASTGMGYIGIQFIFRQNVWSRGRRRDGRFGAGFGSETGCGFYRDSISSIFRQREGSILETLAVIRSEEQPEQSSQSRAARAEQPVQSSSMSEFVRRVVWPRLLRWRAGSAGIQHRRPPPQSVGAVSWFFAKF